jgi:hypothetical protein
MCISSADSLKYKLSRCAVVLSDPFPMSSHQPESLTLKWLRQNVSTYPHRDRVFVDVEAALARFPTLRPKSDIYGSVKPSLSNYIQSLSQLITNQSSMTDALNFYFVYMGCSQ